MADRRFEQLAELFHRARELTRSRRGAFLDESCGNDADLRQEVVSLLEHDREPSSQLATGALARAIVPWTESIPETIGPYRVIDAIGEGGMGIVYRAEQTQPIRRVVAIKRMRPVLGSSAALARFEAERQVLALMHHPNIATVLDAGATPDGRPFVVMELVDGEPITTFCDRRRATIPERLALFLSVCDAIQHAHRNAVIHRDLKPSNVLVAVDAGRPLPKVIDFGIAKALSQPAGELGPVTVGGEILATPEYMSPEQQASPARVDTRTDVHGLGLLLYELLVGAHPFLDDGGSRPAPDELCRRVREDDPPRPSARVVALPAAVAAHRGTSPDALSRRLRGDLDWIVARALAKDPSRRYASPSDLASDVERHLRLDPVTARPPSVSYRVSRRLRKHRTAAALGAVLVVTGLAFVVTATVQTARIAREVDRAKREAAEATRVRDFLLALFERPQGLRGAGGYSFPSDLLASAGDKARGELAERPLLDARLLHAIGTAYLDMALPWKALPVLREADQRLDALVGPDDPRALDAAESLAYTLQSLVQYAEAERILTGVVAGRARTLGPEHELTYRSLARLGALYKDSGRHLEASRTLDQAATGLARIRGNDDPDVLAFRGLWVGSLLELGRYSEVHDALGPLIASMEKVLGPRHGETIIAIYNLGCACARLGDPAAAMHYVGEAVERGFGVPGGLRQDPHLASLVARPEFAALARKSLFDSFGGAVIVDPLADIDRYTVEGRLKRAEGVATELLGGIERAQGTRVHMYTAVVLGRLARLQLLQGRYAEAEKALRERLAIVAAVNGDPVEIADSERYLAECALARNDPRRAMELMRHALALSRFRETSDLWAFADAVQHAAEGDGDASLQSLETAAARGYADAQWLRHDLAFRKLRSTKRFREIVEQVERNGL